MAPSRNLTSTRRTRDAGVVRSQSTTNYALDASSAHANTANNNGNNAHANGTSGTRYGHAHVDSSADASPLLDAGPGAGAAATARSPIISALSAGLSSLRARLPSPRDVSLSPLQREEDANGGGAQGKGKMRSDKEMYPSQLGARRRDTSEADDPQGKLKPRRGDVTAVGSSTSNARSPRLPGQPAYDERGYPLRRGSASMGSSPAIGSLGLGSSEGNAIRTPVMDDRGVDSEETPRASGRTRNGGPGVVSGLMGPEVDDRLAGASGRYAEEYIAGTGAAGATRDRSRRGSTLSSAPSYTTEPITYPPLPAQGLTLGPQLSRDSYLGANGYGGNGNAYAGSSRTVSPAPSFTSEQALWSGGAHRSTKQHRASQRKSRAGGGVGGEGYSDAEDGFGKGYRDTYGYTFDDDDADDDAGVPRMYSSASLVSLDTNTRMTMGREMNVPGYVGLGGKYSLPMDLNLYAGDPEADDPLHDPDERDRSRLKGVSGTPLTLRGLQNLGCLIILAVALVTLFAGFPMITGILSLYRPTKQSGYNIGGINATGQIPATIGNFGLIDKDTPQSAYTRTSLETGATWDLVFSDEFNTAGRTFYPGDDPYWEAADLHYWATNNLEWYDPSQTKTANGNLEIQLTNIPLNGLNYRGGMISSWNKFCFTGGYVETKLSLPGRSDVYGLWPAVWAMGNLGRAGYGGTLDGMWPYSYNECDVGTLPNQTMNGQPEVATYSGVAQWNGALSYLPGQRLSRCTCPNDATHPGPLNSDGSYMGRDAPEIDMFEATVVADTRIGEVSQSAQWAPFNPYYYFINTSTTDYEVYDDTVTHINTYLGGAYQQATSGLSVTDQNCYTQNTGCQSIYGFEYAPGDNGYITWVNNGKKAWTVRGAAMGPNTDAQVGQRHVSDEPMYLIMNVGLSENFGAVDYIGLESLWPVTMEIDYVRVYQDPNAKNVGCDPPTMPTAAYIEHYAEAYNNPNITTWDQVKTDAQKPKNRLVDTC